MACLRSRNSFWVGVEIAAVGEGEAAVAQAARGERIVDVEGQRRARAGAVLDEGGGVGTAVVIGVDLVGAEEVGAVAVVDGGAERELAGVTAQLGAPFPRREKAREAATVTRDRVGDPRPLELAAELERRTLEAKAVKRGVGGQRREGAFAGADIARRVETPRR